MTDPEFVLIKAAIDDLKKDYKEDIAELKATTAGTLASIEKKVADFITGHPKACYFLNWQNGRLRKFGRVLAICGVVLASPAFVLGVAEIMKMLVKGGHP